MSTEKKSLEVMAQEARALANEVFSTEVPQLACAAAPRSRLTSEGVVKKASCLMDEEERPLTRAERDDGWTRRPFWAYDPLRMCSGCAAYFYAERSAQILHEQSCWAQRIEAEEKRKAAVTAGAHQEATTP